jgi:uncharacterized protein YegP (UPF0339 family)
MWFEIYEDCCRQTKEPWRWRLNSRDGVVVATSVSGYIDEESCRLAIAELKVVSINTPVKKRSQERPKNVRGIPIRHRTK